MRSCGHERRPKKPRAHDTHLITLASHHPALVHLVQKRILNTHVKISYHHGPGETAEPDPTKGIDPARLAVAHGGDLERLLPCPTLMTNASTSSVGRGPKKHVPSSRRRLVVIVTTEEGPAGRVLLLLRVGWTNCNLQCSHSDRDAAALPAASCHERGKRNRTGATGRGMRALEHMCVFSVERGDFHCAWVGLLAAGRLGLGSDRASWCSWLSQFLWIAMDRIVFSRFPAIFGAVNSQSRGVAGCERAVRKLQST